MTKATKWFLMIPAVLSANLQVMMFHLREKYDVKCVDKVVVRTGKQKMTAFWFIWSEVAVGGSGTKVMLVTFSRSIHFVCPQLCRPFVLLSHCFLLRIPQSSSIKKEKKRRKKKKKREKGWIIAAFVGCGFEISHINGCHFRSAVAVKYE